MVGEVIFTTNHWKKNFDSHYRNSRRTANRRERSVVGVGGARETLLFLDVGLLVAHSFFDGAETRGEEKNDDARKHDFRFESFFFPGSRPRFDAVKKNIFLFIF